jgi:hypothetical protein
MTPLQKNSQQTVKAYTATRPKVPSVFFSMAVGQTGAKITQGTQKNVR